MFLLIFSLINIQLISGTDWYNGELHVHTEQSSWAGGCFKETFSITGYTAEELADLARAENLDFQSYTDHSYCLDSSEWNTVNSDASTYSDSEVLFLPSEEISVEEDCATSLEELPSCPLTGSAGHLGAHGISNYILKRDGE